MLEVILFSIAECPEILSINSNRLIDLVFVSMLFWVCLQFRIQVHKKTISNLGQEAHVSEKMLSQFELVV